MERNSPPAPPSGILLPVLMTVFLDMLGVSLIVPVLSPLIADNSTGLLGPDPGATWPGIVYGMLMALYPLMQFFGAPMLGAMSDRWGRRPLLFFSILGSLIGYLLFAWGIVTQQLWLLFLGRAIDGFTGGNISIVFSAMADISTPQTRARYFGLVGMMFGLGFVIGPAVGGMLANPELVSWFGPAVPFWTAAILTAINLLLLLRFFPETLKTRTLVKITPLAGFTNFVTAFRMPNLRVLFGVSFFMVLGFASFTQFFSVYTIREFGFADQQIGMVYLYVGLWVSLTQGLLTRYLTQRYSSYSILRVSLFTLGLAIPCLLFPTNPWLFTIIIPFVAMSNGTTMPNLNGLISTQAAPDQQGRIMGINQSIAALGNAIPGLLGGILTGIRPELPMIVSGVLIFISWILFYFLFKPVKS